MKALSKDTFLKLEVANSLSHGIGILFGVSCIPVIIALATMHKNVPGIVGASIYGFSFLMVFTFSTLYHAFQRPQIKQVLKVFDHISIYFLIAGTYTPFILMFKLDATGIAMLATLWGLTLAGIIFKAFFLNRFNIFSTVIYLLMGWMILAGGKAFFVAIPLPVLILVAVGGVLYSLGAVFYLWERLLYHHVIWHFFVLAASICHYVAVLLAVTF